MSELRQDPISGDWVIIAPGRNARPHYLDKKKVPRKPTPKSACPFEDLEVSHNQPIALYPNDKKWRIAVIPNKYPAFDEHEHGNECAVPIRNGIYEMMEGVGEHVIIIGRNHNKNFAELTLDEAAAIFNVFQDRYRIASQDPCVRYATAFCNWGPGAGASVWHPHYQFMAMPALPSHTARSINNAEKYYAAHRRCLRCDIIAFERRKKVRVFAENKYAIALAPYASKFPFELAITPKKHIASFNETPDIILRAAAELVQLTMQQLKKNVNDPDLNFFIHSTAVDGKPNPHHHWHIEIFPRVSTPAGFEFSTGIYINTMVPEDAVEILRK
jgi:UDPglucose--hexose-1-phosphate uridylyltransferase